MGKSYDFRYGWFRGGLANGGVSEDAFGVGKPHGFRYGWIWLAGSGWLDLAGRFWGGVVGGQR